MIGIESFGRAFEVPEPSGERALELYSLAIGVCERAGVIDSFIEASDASEGVGPLLEAAASAAARAKADPDDVEAAAQADAAANRAAEAVRVASAEQARIFGRAAIKLAGAPGALAAVRRTLIGGTVDGTPILADSFATLFATPGQYLTPYAAALQVWMRAGFFGVPRTSGAGRPRPSAPAGVA